MRVSKITMVTSRNSEGSSKRNSERNSKMNSKRNLKMPVTLG